MQNHNKFKFIKALIKFATFYYYHHVLNYPTKPFAAYLVIDYYLRVHSRYEDFIAHGSHILDNIVQLRIKFNEDVIYPLSFSTLYFKRDSWNDDFIFENITDKNIKKFNFQDFILYLAILNNLLSI